MENTCLIRNGYIRLIHIVNEEGAFEHTALAFAAEELCCGELPFGTLRLDAETPILAV